MNTSTACHVCEVNAEFEQGTLPLSQRVAHDAHWRVGHAFVRLPGWLFLTPRRHVRTIAELTDAEAVTLGVWQARLSRALQATTGCTHTYVAQFAEREGFQHVHFHVLPRMANLSEQLIGPGIFDLLKPEHAPAKSEHIDKIVSVLYEQLN